MNEFQEGKKAPSFSLDSSSGKINLKDFLGKKNIVLYFYPKDATPGCTQEACDFRDAYQKFRTLDTEILGISADPVMSHQKFSDKWKLPFPLLSDESREVLKECGVWKEKSLYGRKFMGIERTTVVIDKKGKIKKLFPKVKVKGHVDEVLSVLQELE